MNITYRNIVTISTSEDAIISSTTEREYNIEASPDELLVGNKIVSDLNDGIKLLLGKEAPTVFDLVRNLIGF